jgi:hypothetical protein
VLPGTPGAARQREATEVVVGGWEVGPGHPGLGTSIS